MAVDQHTGDVDRVHAVTDQIARFSPSERDRLARIMVRDMGADLFGPAAAAVGGAFGRNERMAGEYDAAPSKLPGPLYGGGLTLDNIEEVFRYQSWDEEQTHAGDMIRELLTFAAKGMLRNVPPGPLRTRALNHLIDARMIANAAITFRGRF